MSERVEFVGPLESHDVIVDGCRVPLLQAHLGDGGRVLLVFDRRLGLDLDASNYVQVVGFVADIIKGTLDFKHYFPKVHTIESVQTEEADPGDL